MTDKARGCREKVESRDLKDCACWGTTLLKKPALPLLADLPILRLASFIISPPGAHNTGSTETISKLYSSEESCGF